jgi:putative transposase
VLYQELELHLRRKTKRRLPPQNPEPLIAPVLPGHSWSMDFMSDSLYNKVRLRTFNVIDDFNRELLGIDIATGIPSLRVTRYLNRLS